MVILSSGFRDLALISIKTKAKLENLTEKSEVGQPYKVGQDSILLMFSVLL